MCVWKNSFMRIFTIHANIYIYIYTYIHTYIHINTRATGCGARLLELGARVAFAPADGFAVVPLQRRG